MNGIYKIETYSESCADKISGYILKMGGRCVVQGWAVITDHCFSSQNSLSLLPDISRISDDVSESDLHNWNLALQIAA
ncbi:hypothetical protein L3Q72_02615 [Vibrio sp. JC009]|uniref:hypothetical protein n=1 Tax=Vibrio sp. JC009 TaxID=2912314 RepID=UPI0023AFCAC0|nr:hypothetical protein [Vibrio sp. JC009]WED22315.1 hypothetical protein L3Q72_02615 [Vibrio sp. JC009]